MLFLFLTGNSAYQDCPDNEIYIPQLKIFKPWMNQLKLIQPTCYY